MSKRAGSSARLKVIWYAAIYIIIIIIIIYFENVISYTLS